jgi:serpin B
MPGPFPALGLTLALLAGSPAEVQPVVAANNQFALDLFRQLGGRSGNLFFSPYSIHKVLAMTGAGARGATAAEMARVLRLNVADARQHQAYREARQALNAPAAGGLFRPLQRPRDVQLYLSANLWGQRGYAFQKSYLGLVRDCYGAGLEEVDFTAGEQARRTINQRVEQQTNRKIVNLFAEGALDGDTRLALTTASYFKGDWTRPFPKGGTQNESFWTSARQKLQAPLMNQTDTFGYLEDAQVQGLRLPYVGGRLALLVLLPRQVDGLADLEKSLTAAKLAAWLGRLRDQKVIVTLPRFKLEDDFSLKGALAALGMPTAFDDSRADFSGMNGGREKLSIGKVVHKAFVDLNEEGAEAAAATGVQMKALSSSVPSGPPARLPVFRADHPFVFAIYDLRTGMVLFLGRVTKP